ncbi:unnamed protein product [Alopecurus aequalis]
MATLRGLKIKASTCRRVTRELRSYEDEVGKEASKAAAMKNRGADPYDIKQQENVLAESRMMVPDCHKRLQATLADLKATLAELKESGDQCARLADSECAITQVETLLK